MFWERNGDRIGIAVIIVLATLLLVGMAVAVPRHSNGPHIIAEAQRATTTAARGDVFPYRSVEMKLRVLGPSGQTRPTKPPIPGWMHNEMVFVAEIHKQSAYLREGYAPNELLALGVVSCRARNNDLMDVDMGQSDRQLIKNEAQKHLCVFYR